MRISIIHNETKEDWYSITFKEEEEEPERSRQEVRFCSLPV
jgi:hypothetical protein